MSQYSTGFLLQLLDQLLLLRRFEEKAGQLYGLQKIGGFCHLYIGQEAVAVGAVAALDLHRDYVLTAYRAHGHALACGMKPGALMAELFGKITGCSRGKGGSMHLFDAENHFFGGNGIVGAHLPLAAGVALKIKHHREDGVVLCFFGDGAIHQGAFHESLNLAGIWKLPVVFICENNQYGMGTDFRRVSAEPELYRLGASYRIPGRPVDGMDVLAVYEAVAAEVEAIRQESRPAFLEIRTYRYRGHSMSDPAKYRTREELEEYRRQDPVLRLKERMLSGGQLTEEQYQTMDRQAKTLSEDAAVFAEQSRPPGLETRFEDVLA